MLPNKPRIPVIVFLAGIFANAISTAQDGSALRRAADETIALKDNVEASRRVEVVFIYADALLAQEKRKEAIKYLKDGLRMSAFRVDQQLKLAKALAAEKDDKGAQKAADVVFRRAEDDALVFEAKKILGEPMPETAPAPLEQSPETIPTIILVPLGASDAMLIDEVGKKLGARLGVNVIAATVEVTLPKWKRDEGADFLLGLRLNLRGVEKTGGRKVMERLKLKPEDLDDDARLVEFARAYILESEGVRAFVELDSSLRSVALARQWEAEALQDALAAETKGLRRKGVFCIGVTKHDMFAKGTNYVFGLSGDVGIVSYARFRGEFNDEPPDRKRLQGRLLKQLLSTTGLQLGLPRCTSPDCARAYPKSLAEHDAKGDDLCGECKDGVERKLAALKLPR